MAAAATPAAASDPAAPPALLGDDANMTEEEADDMLEDQCLHPIVIPHDAARAEIEAAVAEDAPDNVVDPASAQAIVAPKQYLKVIDLTLPTDGTAPNFIDLTNSGRNPCGFSEAFFTPKKDNNKKYAGHVTKQGCTSSLRQIRTASASLPRTCRSGGSGGSGQRRKFWK